MVAERGWCRQEDLGSGVKGLILVFVFFHDVWIRCTVGVPRGGELDYELRVRGITDVRGDLNLMVKKLQEIDSTTDRNPFLDWGWVFGEKLVNALKALRQLRNGQEVSKSRADSRLQARVNHWESRVWELEGVC